MRRFSISIVALTAALAAPSSAQERSVVEASVPEALAVTVYRDPNRSQWQPFDRFDPRGFAMISETRTVILPPGESTIRFDGVSEGMVAVSAIVTGLPGGTIEKNRNADLLSPAALVDGTLGNRVTITRTNPGTGEENSEDAIVRTRADGGLVLQTEGGYEAVRCSGLPERLTFDGVPDGLSANPVFTIDTASDTGGTYTVTLSYLSWGFDWQANYVASVHDGRESDDIRFDLTSWLTILNDNGQSFENAELMAVAGTLNIVSDFQQLADPPMAEPLSLSCWPIGSTAAGSPYPNYNDVIVVTGMRARDADLMEVAMPMAAVSAETMPPPPPPPPPVMAGEEQLGDLKLYRIPVPMDLNAQGLKQVLFLQEEDVEGSIVYETTCYPWAAQVEPLAVSMLLETVNDEDSGLGVALPSGTLSVFEQTPIGEFLINEVNQRDYASGQDVEIGLGGSSQVFAHCTWETDRSTSAWRYRWTPMSLELTNANPHDVTVRVEMSSPAQWEVRGLRTGVRDGQRFFEARVPANGTRRFDWETRLPQADD